MKSSNFMQLLILGFLIHLVIKTRWLKKA